MAQGKRYQPTLVPEDIHATPITYVPQEPNLVTAGCPCDVCDIRVGCVTECARFKLWVIKGPTKEQKDEARIKLNKEKHHAQES